MPKRNAQSTTFRPAGVTDSLDGTNSFSGSMKRLQNLVADYRTPNVFVPRAAAVRTIDLSSINPAGVVSALLVVGNIVWGMISSVTYPGKDQPFCYDLVAQHLVPISGVTAALLPATQPTTGDWIPPVMLAVTNSRIILTHPGFFGGAAPYFGWVDTSSYVSTVMKANTTAGSPLLASVQTIQGNSAPILQGVQPGQSITGPGIPAGTYVVSASNGTFSLATTGNTHSNTTLDSLASTAGVQVGMTVSGSGINPGTFVQAIVSGTAVTLSQPAVSTVVADPITFTGGGTITISANATATANSVALSVAGGTAAAPLWGAGNTNTNPLVSPPICVGTLSGRAYYGVGNAAVYSDPLNPTQVSLATQVLILGDATPITALVGLPLTAQLTGGIQQSLAAFKGTEQFYQITGDPTTGNLAQNAVTGSVGTLAPNTIAQTPIGVAYMAVDGLRVLGLTGTVSDPIGLHGTGVALPFIDAVYPSRMCAAYAENVYRITVQDGTQQSPSTYEYWFDLTQKSWTGPHTFPAAQIAAFPNGSSSLVAPIGLLGALWQSDAVPTYRSVYVENGVQLSFSYETSSLPDNGASAFNRVGQASIACALAQSSIVTAQVSDDNGKLLGSYSFGGSAAAAGMWTLAPGAGLSLWGSAPWGTPVSSLREYALRWAQPLVFRQATFLLTGASLPGLAFGNLYVNYQVLGYNVPVQF